MPSQVLSLALLVLSSLSSSVEAGKIQAPNLSLPSGAAANAARVKSAFISAFGDYKRFAYGHDDLAPLSTTSKTPWVDSRNGWGSTIIDSMSTMKIMGLDTLFSESVAYAATINFNFETTIRYLGGLLASYELNGKKDQALLDQAIRLGDKLSFAWVGDNDLPYNSLDFNTNTPDVATSNIASVGSSSLEFGKLSELSGNPKYRNLVEKTIRKVATNPAPLPGLAAQGVDPADGSPIGDYIVHLGGASDSYFEYLLKYGRLTNNADPLWIETWKAAVDSSIRYLAKTSSVGGHLYLTDYTRKQNVYVGSHLECFHGGNWIMGGKLLDNQTIVDYGLKLVDACINTYQSTVTGIGPEVFAYIGSDGGNYTGGPRPSPSDMDFYNQHGFYVYNGYSYYDLRPEVLESNFYAWRATGDVKYQNNAATALTNILKNCKAPAAYAPIQDVTKLNSGFFDDTESFFFAEVMKYLYLTFDDPKHISLDEWVFNTEAQPLRAPAELSTYGLYSASRTSNIAFQPNSGAIAMISPSPILPKQLVDVVKDAVEGLQISLGVTGSIGKLLGFNNP
ncbi:glycoside hydrolase family 47 protein [Hydnum rufescens UP504]|uniref:alpha-1,2-Mannosidase n=1 Tax=Hydnum rufescens UP504 TaxID=1448309 RepID=A0A9P6B4Z5_9AGAM|nr:glycoside hydrolase family 47 protein [Hydnum rufescens UP504]